MRHLLLILLGMSGVSRSACIPVGNITVCLSFSPSPTITKTSTISPTPTNTTGYTSTVTPTTDPTSCECSLAGAVIGKYSETKTPTLTQSATLTTTRTATLTTTPTPTGSNTASPTWTTTATSTYTVTITTTLTVTTTATNSWTQTQTATPTQSQTHTFSPTVSQTFTTTPTPRDSSEYLQQTQIAQAFLQQTQTAFPTPLPLGRSAAGSFTAVNQSLTLSTTGMGAASVQLSGTWVGTIAYIVSTDGGTTWNNYKGISFRDGNSTNSDTINNNRVFALPSSAFFGVSATAWTSGTAVVSIEASNGATGLNKVLSTADGTLLVYGSGASGSSTLRVVLTNDYLSTDKSQVQGSIASTPTNINAGAFGSNDTLQSSETGIDVRSQIYGYDYATGDRSRPIEGIRSITSAGMAAISRFLANTNSLSSSLNGTNILPDSGVTDQGVNGKYVREIPTSTSTGTPTRTPSPTATQTWTPTASMTHTFSPTRSLTPTSTMSPDSTTRTATLTNSPTKTWTPTATSTTVANSNTFIFNSNINLDETFSGSGTFLEVLTGAGKTNRYLRYGISFYTLSGNPADFGFVRATLVRATGASTALGGTSGAIFKKGAGSVPSSASTVTTWTSPTASGAGLQAMDLASNYPIFNLGTLPSMFVAPPPAFRDAYNTGTGEKNWTATDGQYMTIRFTTLNTTRPNVLSGSPIVASVYMEWTEDDL